MSLEYYLYCRTRYNNIIMCLEEVISNHDLIFFETSKLAKDVGEIIIDELNLVQDNANFINKLKYLKELKKTCDIKINLLCKHEYEDDMIDISPDRSEKIEYCTICGHTK